MSKQDKPTRTQLKVLKAVHNQAAMAKLMQDRARAQQQKTGELPPSSWYEDFHGHALLRQQLENAAAAAAVPNAWIDQSRQRGDLGTRWRADLYWRDPEPINRNSLLAGLEQQVRRVQDMVVIAAVYGDDGARAEVGTAQLFNRKLRVLAHHVRAVASVLNVSTEEADQLWGESTWATATAAVRDLDATELGKRWRTYAGAAITDLALQAKALGDAGLPPERGVWEHLVPATMIDEARTRVSMPTSEPDARSQPGTQISEAINAAGISGDANTPLDTDTIAMRGPAVETTPGIEP